jgi:hypothetical protein
VRDEGRDAEMDEGPRGDGFQGHMVHRLPDDRARFVKAFGATRFEPMPGRVMREYVVVVVPKVVLETPRTLASALTKAKDDALALPPTAAKGRKPANSRGQVF